MRRQLQSALLLGLSALAAAIFQDEVGHIDFHHSLVGIPQREATFYHRPKLGTKASLLYTLSDLGVVGAINPASGETVWRHQLSDDVSSSAGHLRAPADEEWVATAQGPRVQAWNGLTGRNVWEAEFKGEARDVEVIEVTDTSRKDVVVLFDEDGTTVLRRLHGGLGTVMWEFRETTKDIPLQVSTDIASIYIVSLHGSPSSYSVKTTEVDPSNGKRVDQWTVGSKGDVATAEDVMFVGGNSAAPIIAWRRNDKLSIQILGTKTKHDIALASDVEFVDIQAPYLKESQARFLVHTASKSGNRAEVFSIDIKNAQIKKTHELPHLQGRGSFSTSCEGANVYFTRVTDDEIQVLSSESHEGVARWKTKLDGAVKPIHSVSEVIYKSDNDYAVRTAILTEDHDWIQIRNGEKDWVRHEGLSGSVAAVWAEIPEQENLARVLAGEVDTNPLRAYVHRVLRHIDDLQYLPGYLASIPGKILASIAGDEPASNTGGLYSDMFGFNKIVVLVTRRGRFYGLDTGNKGAVLWTRNVLPQAAGESLSVKGFAVTEDSGVVALRGSRGESVLIRATDGHVDEAKAAYSTTPVISSTAVVDGEVSAWLLAFGPDGSPIDETLGGQLADQTFVVRGEGESVKGIKIVADGKKIKKQDIWEIKAADNQRIVDIATLPAHDPIASIGRVLGDRQVQYKYLNPNTAVIASINDKTSVMSIKLIDTISGQVLTAETYEGVDAGKSVSCTMSENWFACSFFGQYALNDDSDRSIQGYQIVVSDLYESATPNDRGPLGDNAQFSSLKPIENPLGVALPFVASQSWVVSQPLTKLTVTQTRQGIANRNIVAYLPESHAVVALPRVLLDPRRPIGRDPTANEIEAEGLPRYMPAIEIDTRSILSHDWDILGVEGFTTSPAVVESTSLLVAYGIDVYGTRVVPSGLFDLLGKGFNKLALISTVLALTGGVLFVAPMVRRNQINRRWEAFI
ncbi:ER membrane protein complex subunit 1 [Beauveria bassiana]|nr:ER membrane protein complex subunit 1 [Beauveria bassiana]KAH8720010.1 ER membrane protein complex subunit 1 [Beauveria bassiana]